MAMTTSHQEHFENSKTSTGTCLNQQDIFVQIFEFYLVTQSLLRVSNNKNYPDLARVLYSATCIVL
jgi:hypothetical protein